ncbi:MAG: NADH-quinone oxidoreductase subunit M, partial [Coleofasciculus sp. C2-GNP5-27]
MLSTLIGLPVVGAIIIGFLRGMGAKNRLRAIALAVATAIVLVTLWLATQFDITYSGWQFQEELTWIPQLGLSYKLGTDGLSFPLLALGSLLNWVVIFSSRIDVERLRLKYALILLVNAGVTGAFLAQNLLLFVLFYELVLIPLYLLIAIWGGSKREYAAMKFLMYTAVSGILILAAFLGMTWLSNSTSFNYEAIQTQGLSLTTQLILLSILLVGFGIKIPLVPLHTWLPDAYVEASPVVAILLGGVVAKMGTYGLVRYGLQLFPETWSLVAPGLSIVGVVSVLYGALSAIAQKDIKRMVAYSSIGHMGYIVVAAAALTPLSLLGCV